MRTNSYSKVLQMVAVSVMYKKTRAEAIMLSLVFTIGGANGLRWLGFRWNTLY